MHSPARPRVVHPAPLPALWALALCCCGPADLDFPAPGPLDGPAGRGGFRFGAATAATQIEDQDTATDWYVFTLPVALGSLGLGKDFVGDAVRGYTRALDDIALLTALHLDAYTERAGLTRHVNPLSLLGWLARYVATGAGPLSPATRSAAGSSGPVPPRGPTSSSTSCRSATRRSHSTTSRSCPGGAPS